MNKRPFDYRLARWSHIRTRCACKATVMCVTTVEWTRPHRTYVAYVASHQICECASMLSTNRRTKKAPFHRREVIRHLLPSAGPVASKGAQVEAERAIHLASSQRRRHMKAGNWAGMYHEPRGGCTLTYIPAWRAPPRVDVENAQTYP